MFSDLKTMPGYWIGLYDPHGVGSYTWRDGSVVDYLMLDTAVPGMDTLRCVKVKTSGVWHRENCHQLQASICKKPAGQKTFH